eukprot:5251439-Pyramimonas_sp.AAC.1
MSTSGFHDDQSNGVHFVSTVASPARPGDFIHEARRRLDADWAILIHLPSVVKMPSYLRPTVGGRFLSALSCWPIVRLRHGRGLEADAGIRDR